MEKIHLIGWAMAIILIGASATTAYVTSTTDAKTLLGTTNDLQITGCKIYSITKEATTQKEVDEKDWEVRFALEYTINGKQTREGVKTAYIKNNTETDAKNAVEPICEQDWQNAQTKYTNIDKVIIETDAKDNPVLEKIYNPATQIWASLTEAN